MKSCFAVFELEETSGKLRESRAESIPNFCWKFCCRPGEARVKSAAILERPKLQFGTFGSCREIFGDAIRGEACKNLSIAILICLPEIASEVGDAVAKFAHDADGANTSGEANKFEGENSGSS